MDLDEPLDFENDDPLVNPPATLENRSVLLCLVSIGLLTWLRNWVHCRLNPLLSSSWVSVKFEILGLFRVTGKFWTLLFHLCDAFVCHCRRKKVIGLDDLLSDFYKEKSKILNKQNRKRKASKLYDSDEDEHAQEALLSKYVDDCQNQAWLEIIPILKLYYPLDILLCNDNVRLHVSDGWDRWGRRYPRVGIIHVWRSG